MKRIFTVVINLFLITVLLCPLCEATSTSRKIVDYVYCGMGVYNILYDDGTVYELYNGGKLGTCKSDNVERIQCKYSPLFFHKDGTLSIGTPFGYSSDVTYELDSEWTDIILADASYGHAVGMRSDGTMLSVGNNIDGQCNVDNWTDIIDLRVGEKHTVGLKSDGTVVATGDNEYRQCDVTSWTDIISISVGDKFTVGLKTDGTVVSTGKNKKITDNWQNVKYLIRDYSSPTAITKDNSVLSTYEEKENKTTYGIPIDYAFEDIKDIAFDWHCVIISHNDNRIEFFAEDDKKDYYAVKETEKEYEFILNGMGDEISPSVDKKVEVGNSASLAGLSYEQVIDMIDAISVDGVKVFSQGQKGSMQSDNREDFFTQQGAALVWMGDTNNGSFILFDNMSKNIHMWNGVDKRNIKDTFDIIGPIIAPYVDYEIGGKLTFILTSSDAFTAPFAKLEYSPIIDTAHRTDSARYNEYYSDLDSFYSAVKHWFNVAFGGEDADTVHQNNEQRNNAGNYPVLQKGSKGNEVKKLQERLNELGYSVGKADGDFGNKTKSAIEEFQKDNGLEVTGIADEATQELLFSDEVNKKTNTESSSESKTNSDTVKAVASGIDYITDFALRTAPPVFSAFGSTDTCKVTEIYCQDKGNDVYHFTAKVKNGTSIIGFGEDLKITYSNGKANIEEVSSLNMYMDAGLNNIPGKMVWSTSDNGYDALLDAFKAIDINGDGHITKDEIFK